MRARGGRRDVDPERWLALKCAVVWALIAVSVGLGIGGVLWGLPIVLVLAVSGSVVVLCALYLVFQRRIERYDRAVRDGNDATQAAGCLLEPLRWMGVPIEFVAMIAVGIGALVKLMNDGRVRAPRKRKRGAGARGVARRPSGPGR